MNKNVEWTFHGRYIVKTSFNVGGMMQKHAQAIRAFNSAVYWSELSGP